MSAKEQRQSCTFHSVQAIISCYFFRILSKYRFKTLQNTILRIKLFFFVMTTTTTDNSKISAAAKKFVASPHSVQRILVCQLHQIGDVLLASPALELLAKQFPLAEVHVCTEKRCASMLENNPHVHKIWIFDRKIIRTLRQEFAFYAQIHAQHFDIAVALQQVPRCRWTVLATRAPVRLSYTPAWHSRLFFNTYMPHAKGYAAESKANILRPLGIEWHGERPRLYLTSEEKQDAADILAQCGVNKEHTLISVDPTHRRETRRYPAELYGKTLALLAQKHANMRFLLHYGPGEEDDVRAVAKASGLPENVCIIPHKFLSLRQMSACIAQADLHIGNCSAPRHIAVAVDTPSLIVLGSTSGAWTFPSPEHQELSRNLPCQPCDRNTCKRHDMACLTSLAPEVFAEAIEKHLADHCKK